MGIVAWLVLGTVAGYVAGRMVRDDGRLGAVGHIMLGIVGALVGGFLADSLLGTNPVAGLDIRSMIVATIGAIIAIVVWDAMTEPVRRPEPSIRASTKASTHRSGRASTPPATRVQAPRRGRRPV
jgi:uncharacterized membrane protein YeaQ/YmgE (transglycosylase-associated protein family)